MTVSKNTTGGCQCGSIRYSLVGPPEMLYVCHCTDCQQQSSSAFGMSLRIHPGHIDFTSSKKSLRSWETRGDDGGIKRCHFCPDCGTRIMHSSDNPDETVSIKAGSLDDTSGLQPIAHIWLSSAQPWVEIDRERYRCFDKDPEDEEELRRLWRANN